ncbi:hypothetical protein D6833_07485 [Candidatus Parcubacteria bacterium]|nr:MAG: hypothetical protein D6833_07485 [Candidatus Parcubacteria bacterium]
MTRVLPIHADFGFQSAKRQTFRRYAVCHIPARIDREYLQSARGFSEDSWLSFEELVVQPFQGWRIWILYFPGAMPRASLFSRVAAGA